MVFFTCNICGESVKKASVEKHYNTKCRGAPKSVSCMDCLQDFHGEAYVQHTKCITEAEKYSGKDYVPKESKNSGANKQIAWINAVRSILVSSDYKLSAPLRRAFEGLQNFENVPRKKAKFENFVHNCMRQTKPTAQAVWNILEQELEKMKLARAAELAEGKDAKEGVKTDIEATTPDKVIGQTPDASQNGDNRVQHEKGNAKKRKSENSLETEEVKASKAKKQKTKNNGTNGKTNGVMEISTKRKHLNSATEENGPSTKKKLKSETNNGNNEDCLKPISTETTSTVDIDKFEWATVIEKVMTKNANGILLEKLKKKLKKKYFNKLGVLDPTEKHQRQFEKKLSKYLKRSTTVAVDKDMVMCC